MNYIELINNFWELDETWQFSCCETRLYFYLLKTANRLGWENSWTHSDVKTAANVGVSVNSFKSARNKLVQSGLISFNIGGKGYGNKTRYQILIPKLYPKPIPKVEPINKLKEEVNLKPPLPNGSVPPKKNDFEKRKKSFMNDCAIFVEKYGKEMVRAFFNYWTEPNKSNSKMRFELEKTWDLEFRFLTWDKNESKFNSNGTNKKVSQRPSSTELNSAVRIGIALAKAAESEQ